MLENKSLGHGGTGMHGDGAESVAAMVRQLQSLRVSLVTGGTADTKRDLGDIRMSDVIVSALNNNGGTITDVTSTMSIDDLRAKGTITLTTVDPDDTVTVNDVTYVAGVDFAIAATVALTAENLAKAIHHHESTYGQAVSASAADEVVTVVARAEGTAGNAIDLAKVGAGIAVSGTTLADGAAAGGVRSTGTTNQIIVFWMSNPLR